MIDGSPKKRERDMTSCTAPEMDHLSPQRANYRDVRNGPAGRLAAFIRFGSAS